MASIELKPSFWETDILHPFKQIMFGFIKYILSIPQDIWKAGHYFTVLHENWAAFWNMLWFSHQRQGSQTHSTFSTRNKSYFFPPIYNQLRYTLANIIHRWKRMTVRRNLTGSFLMSLFKQIWVSQFGKKSVPRVWLLASLGFSKSLGAWLWLLRMWNQWVLWGLLSTGCSYSPSMLKCSACPVKNGLDIFCGLQNMRH